MNVSGYIKVKVLPKCAQVEEGLTDTLLSKFCDTERLVPLRDFSDFKSNKEVKFQTKTLKLFLFNN